MIYVLSGGAGLNLKVVGGTTQPTSPKENTVWVNTDIDIHSYAFSATQPHRVSKNKNLNVYPYFYTTRTISGVTWTDNGDGTLKVNGTASASTSSVFRCSHTGVANHEMLLAPGTYHLSGCPAGGSSAKYALAMAYSYDDWATTTWVNDYGSGVTITLTAEAKARLTCSVIKAVTVSNLVFKPQLEKGSTATSFVKGDATGMVWFSTGTSSNAAMNVDKKNTVMLYPLSCKQYVSGAWVDKTAMSYVNGEWKDWMLVLWDSGDNEAATGGWTSQYFNSSGSANYSGGSVSVSSGTVTLSTENTGAAAGQSYTTIDAIDMTPYKTMKIYITDGVDNGYGYASTAFFGVTTARTGTAQWTGKKAGTSITPSIAKAQTFVTVDVTNVNEPCYILTAIEKGGGAVETYCSISFNKIELY